MKSISKGCYPSHLNLPQKERILRVLPIWIVETGSIFECSTDIRNIEKNIAFWIYLLTLLISMCVIIFYLLIKYGDESKDELLKVETVLDNGGMLCNIDRLQPVNGMSESGKKSEMKRIMQLLKPLLMQIESTLS